ncbi:conserved exported hypothetical protein [Verrucomicrobia bacterium]|nr:conserved exported hypothetical protein [Verrucomicrobiota bacterium]
MKIKRPSDIIGGVALVGVAVAVAGALYLFHANDLGLTGFDMVMGGRPKMAALHANIRAAADSFLAQHKSELAVPSDEAYELAVDYSKSSRVRAQGYRSSFYYYCWDVYLPYSLRTRSGKTATVLVHLSDAVQGHGHDPQKFRVLDVRLLDEQGRTTKQINGV